MITLLFSTQTWHPVDALIRWRTNGEWSHVEAVLGERCIGARLGHGVEERGLMEAMGAASKWAWGYVEPPEREMEEGFWGFLRAQLGKPYDWRGALGIGLNDRDWQKPDSWFCSELVAAGFAEAGWPLIMQHAFWVRPDDLCVSVRVECCRTSIRRVG